MDADAPSGKGGPHQHAGEADAPSDGGAPHQHAGEAATFSGGGAPHQHAEEAAAPSGGGAPHQHAEEAAAPSGGKYGLARTTWSTHHTRLIACLVSCSRDLTYSIADLFVSVPLHRCCYLYETLAPPSVEVLNWTAQHNL